MNYKVNSDRIAGHAHGDTVNADELGSANIDALVAAGHLVIVGDAEPKPKNRKTDTAEPEGMSNDG